MVIPNTLDDVTQCGEGGDGVGVFGSSISLRFVVSNVLSHVKFVLERRICFYKVEVGYIKTLLIKSL